MELDLSDMDTSNTQTCRSRNTRSSRSSTISTPIRLEVAKQEFEILESKQRMKTAILFYLHNVRNSWE